MQVDREGHVHTYDSPEYRAAIEYVDGLVGDLVTAINGRSTIANEDWLIMLSADHGGRSDDTTHGPNSELFTRTIPYIVSGNSALQGVDLGTPSIFDVTPTALAHLGVDVDALGLTGTPVGLAVPEPSSFLVCAFGLTALVLQCRLARKGLGA